VFQEERQGEREQELRNQEQRQNAQRLREQAEQVRSHPNPLAGTTGTGGNAFGTRGAPFGTQGTSRPVFGQTSFPGGSASAPQPFGRGQGNLPPAGGNGLGFNYDDNSSNEAADRNQTDMKWRPADIGFFDPDLDESHGLGDYVTVGNNVYWRNVFLFTNQVRDNARAGREQLVAKYLQNCLKGSALTWYAAELSDEQRTLLRFSFRGVNDWIEQLIKRFKDPPALALKKLHSTKYTMSNARGGRDGRSYIANVLRYAKAAELDKPIQQLAYAYNNLDPELRPFVTRPTEHTTVQEFMDEIAAKQDAWKDMLDSRRQFQSRNDNPRRSDARSTAITRLFRACSGSSSPTLTDHRSLRQRQDRRQRTSTSLQRRILQKQLPTKSTIQEISAI